MSSDTGREPATSAGDSPEETDERGAPDNGTPFVPDSDSTAGDGAVRGAEKWSRTEDEEVHDEPESE